MTCRHQIKSKPSSSSPPPTFPPPHSPPSSYNTSPNSSSTRQSSARTTPPLHFHQAHEVRQCRAGGVRGRSDETDSPLRPTSARPPQRKRAPCAKISYFCSAECQKAAWKKHKRRRARRRRGWRPVRQICGCCTRARATSASRGQGRAGDGPTSVVLSFLRGDSVF